ncbi:MAG: 2-amino-4-hydroxy-6-hydroxymethyldihydropteridine diphosphokinase [Proteobacteria bacterium]|nr:2-amino-4-hydroxy-6-hydroxymethyldihydropteridine diphosphokinase [Pseudomonadota bacterium]
MAKVYLGLGSNINSENHLRLGVRELRLQYGVLELSRVYRNAAVGFEGADFLNMVVGLETDDSPGQIQDEIAAIHRLIGRGPTTPKYSSRALDIDLLLYDDLICDEPGLQLPRRDVLDYSFVLRPLAELAPGFLHPVTGKSIAAQWAEYDKDTHPLTLEDVIL